MKIIFRVEHEGQIIVPEMQHVLDPAVVTKEQLALDATDVWQGIMRQPGTVEERSRVSSEAMKKMRPLEETVEAAGVLVARYVRMALRAWARGA